MAIWRLDRALLVGALFCAPAVAAEPKTATLDVPGMFCALCQISVRKALERVPGVFETKAAYATKRADVKYDPDKTSPQALADALRSAGFAAKVKQ